MLHALDIESFQEGEPWHFQVTLVRGPSFLCGASQCMDVLQNTRGRHYSGPHIKAVSRCLRIAFWEPGAMSGATSVNKTVTQETVQYKSQGPGFN